jgi:UDP-N-acetylglucosamine acyltransferase
MTTIHATAIIAPTVKLGANVSIGPYCVVDGEVTIGDNCVLKSHVAISGKTAIGAQCTIYPFASIGHVPQDLKYHGETSSLTIGSHNTIREYVTMNPGTQGGGMVTSVGDHCLFMAGSHVAHDCKVGNHVILANNATLAGHVEVGDHAIIGGLAAIHQFVRVGRHAIVGGMSGVEHDVIPYGSVMGERASLAGLNLIGLKRRGFDRDTIHALRNAYKALFEDDSGTLADRADRAQAQYKNIEAVMEIVAFMSSKGSRSLCVPKASSRIDDEQAA